MIFTFYISSCLLTKGNYLKPRGGERRRRRGRRGRFVHLLHFTRLVFFVSGSFSPCPGDDAEVGHGKTGKENVCRRRRLCSSLFARRVVCQIKLQWLQRIQCFAPCPRCVSTILSFSLICRRTHPRHRYVIESRHTFFSNLFISSFRPSLTEYTQIIIKFKFNINFFLARLLCKLCKNCNENFLET